MEIFIAIVLVLILFSSGSKSEKKNVLTLNSTRRVLTNEELIKELEVSENALRRFVEVLGFDSDKVIAELSDSTEVRRNIAEGGDFGISHVIGISTCKQMAEIYGDSNTVKKTSAALENMKTKIIYRKGE